MYRGLFFSPQKEKEEEIARQSKPSVTEFFFLKGQRYSISNLSHRRRSNKLLCVFIHDKSNLLLIFSIKRIHIFIVHVL